jgi:hypothetical protein
LAGTYLIWNVLIDNGSIGRMLSMTDIKLVIKVLIIVKLVCALDAKMVFACKASESTYNLREIFAGDLSK